MVTPEQLDQIRLVAVSAEEKSQSLLVMFLALAFALWLIDLSHRRFLKELSGELPHPSGSWPPGVKERYLALGPDARQRWQKHYDLAVSRGVVPLFVMTVFVAFFIGDLALVAPMLAATALMMGFATGGLETEPAGEE
jgi:hypothetical protein